MILNRSATSARSNAVSVRCSAVPAVTARRSVLAVPLLAGAGVLLDGAPALAYGGRKELMALDSGSGNPTYDALMADIKKRNAETKNSEFSDASKKLEAASKADKPPRRRGSS